MKPMDVRTARILIVDAQEADLRLLEHMLRDHGYARISTTADAAGVSALHRENPFDLILLDSVPAIDRRQLMKALKADSVDAPLCVIVLTARPGQQERALQAGARDVINKPFDPIEVRTRVHNILEIRLLYKQLEACEREQDQRVKERTAELELSRARFQGLTELASDWYWEQDATGAFTTVWGPVLELLGLEPVPNEHISAERNVLYAKIAARESFLDFVFSRNLPDGSRQSFRVSGQPIFDRSSNFTGYRGIGVEITRHTERAP